MKRRTRTTTRKSTRKAGNGQLTWKSYVIGTLVVVFLLSTLFFAGRNHFASVRYGFKNAELRGSIDQLQAEKRRLLVSKEIAMSPAEINKAARKLGFLPMTANNIEGVSTGDEVAKSQQAPNPKQPGQMVAGLNAPASPKKVAKTGLVTPSSDTQRRN